MAKGAKVWMGSVVKWGDTVFTVTNKGLDFIGGKVTPVVFGNGVGPVPEAAVVLVPAS